MKQEFYFWSKKNPTKKGLYWLEGQIAGKYVDTYVVVRKSKYYKGDFAVNYRGFVYALKQCRGRWVEIEKPRKKNLFFDLIRTYFLGIMLHDK